MASLQLVFDILARDAASAAFNNVGNAAGNAGQQTSAFSKTLKAAGGALIGGGLISGLRSLYDAAAESAKVSALTEAAIRSTGGVANVTAQQVGELASALSEKTAIDDEAIQSASNLLLTFTKVRNEVGEGNDIFDQATEAALNMSTALGTDATSAATMLGKALNDPIKGISAMSRAGVQFTEDQKEQIRTLTESGRVLEAQKIILAELETQFGGAAAAAATPFQRLQVTLGNLAEEAGAHLIPVFDGFAKLLMEDVGPIVGSVLGFMADNIPLVLGLATALGVYLVGGITAVTIAFNAWILTPIVLGLVNLIGVVLALPTALATAATAVAGFIAAIAPLAAIGGLVYAITSIISAADDVEERLEAAADAGEDFGLVLAQQGGKINETTREAALLAAESAGLSDAFDRAGVSSTTLTEALTGNAESFEELRAAAVAADEQATLAGNDWGTLGIAMDVVSGKSTENADALDALSGAIEAARGKYKEASDVVPLFGASLETLGEQASSAATVTEEAAERTAEATEKWRQEISSINDAFIDPLATYKFLLDEKSAKERESAEATAAATDSAEDSWEDYVSEVQVSLDEYAAQLDAQIVAQQNWQTNLATIARRGGEEVATILFEMGEQGAGITDQMANATEEDFQHMRDSLIREAALAGAGASGALDRELQIMAEIGRQGANATVKSISDALNIGADEVARISSKFSVNLASGINPLLGALGKPGVNISGAINSGGGRADGGFINGYSPNSRADNILTPTTAGEHVQPVKRVKQYGGDLFEAFRAGWIDVNAARSLLHPGRADGGFISTSAVPKPPSTSPYRPPLSTAGDATMERAYGDTVDWLEENLIPPATSLAGPGNYAAMFAAVQKAFPYVRLHSGYRPGSITATGNLSYHASGRAIDITPDASIFEWIYRNYFSPTRELIYSPMGSRQIWNGQHHYYSEPTRGDHWDHIHWAMANGGVINEPVYGVGRSGATYSFGERGPETVLPGVPMRVGASAAGADSANIDYDRLAKAIGGRSTAISVTVPDDRRAIARAVFDAQRDLEFLGG